MVQCLREKSDGEYPDDVLEAVKSKARSLKFSANQYMRDLLSSEAADQPEDWARQLFDAMDSAGPVQTKWKWNRAELHQERLRK